MTLLSKKSPCDNVLLEYRLALELRERNMLTFIYPLLVGDKVVDDDNNISYTDYFISQCHPVCANDVLVESIEIGLQDHLNRLSL